MHLRFVVRPIEDRPSGIPVTKAAGASRNAGAAPGSTPGPGSKAPTPMKVPHAPSKRSEGFSSPLVHARRTHGTRRGLLAVVISLLAPEVAIGQDDRGLTASEVIRRRRPPRELRAALGRGRPGETNIDGDTAIHLAAAAENPDYLDILLEYGMSKNTPNSVTGQTPLVSAMMAERVAQFERLLEVGADPGRADRTGNTPLHVAGQINDARFALRLLEAGAPPDARNDQGRTFRTYIYMTPDRLLSRRARRERALLTEYLRRQGHALTDE